MSFADDGSLLRGTLILPDEEGPFPAIVTVTGSGRQDRDEHIRAIGPEYRPFRDIADTLARRGIATLRFDDPGVGGSDPFPPGATPFDYADAVRAGLEYLRSRPDIAPDRIGLLGHSEGGVVAPAAAVSDGGVAALVLLAGPAYTLARVSAFQRRRQLRRDMATASSEVIEAELERTAPLVERRALRSPWRRAVWEYDPLPTARRFAAPVLLLQGDSDRRISPEQADTLAAAFREGGNQDVTVRKFSGTNHWFLKDRTASVEGERAPVSQRLPPEVLGVIADWVVDRLTPEEHD
ncbi:MAG TPA: alpha/beta fold hydrolase [Longimicrobiales bacterium]|nr:alpha/beta fold hydrolase [Longimicrobiales bacterium]